jgi:biopolymer transport protein ExbD
VLPTSFSNRVPENNLVVMVNATDVVVGGRSVGKVQDLMRASISQFAPLATELKYQAQKAGPLKAEDQQTGRPVTIMADQKLPYELLKKIMVTCAEAEYRNISLAVTQKQLSADEVLKAAQGGG